MDVFKAAEKLMSMDDAAWERHANPWSGISRFSCGPLLILAIWSRDWIGWWALIPIALALFWTWWNPRAFGPPSSTDNWMSKGVFGERVFLKRDATPIPSHHERAAKILGWASLPGMLLLVWGLWELHAWATISGAFMALLPKLWFVDRMVWLYQDMRDATPEYASWLRR